MSVTPARTLIIWEYAPEERTIRLSWHRQEEYIRHDRFSIHYDPCSLTEVSEDETGVDDCGEGDLCSDEVSEGENIMTGDPLAGRRKLLECGEGSQPEWSAC